MAMCLLPTAKKCSKLPRHSTRGTRHIEVHCEIPYSSSLAQLIRGAQNPSEKLDQAQLISPHRMFVGIHVRKRGSNQRLSQIRGRNFLFQPEALRGRNDIVRGSVQKEDGRMKRAELSLR